MVQLAGGPFGLGPLELVIILLVLVMLFGATRLADLGGSLGKGIREFRKEVQTDDGDEEIPPPPAAPTASAAATTGNGTVQAVQCPKCESLNQASAKHCSQCGAALTTTPVS